MTEMASIIIRTQYNRRISRKIDNVFIYSCPSIDVHKLILVESIQKLFQGFLHLTHSSAQTKIYVHNKLANYKAIKY